MSFWENLSPLVRRSLLVGAVVLVVLFVVKQMASTPASNITTHRGIGAQP